MSKRVLAVLVAALVASAVAVLFLRPARGVPDGAPTEEQMARDLGTPIMEHIFLGHVPDRSGEVMLVPRPNNFLIGEWDLTTLGSSQPTLSTSHPNPWNYLTRVPIIVRGWGIGSIGSDETRPVGIADLPVWYADILGLPIEDLEGEPLLGAPAKRPPKLIFTVVIDGGGWNALQEHPDSWPNIARLREEGITFVNATIGSAPSITGALHATFGTGVYPRTHGIPGNQMRDPDGENTDTWLQNADPRYLETPAVSELWDEATDNRAIVGTVSYEGWHLGMIGHGAQREGGDKDIAVLWEAENANEWWVNEDYYELPDYLLPTDVARLESYEEQLDLRDGLSDGLWFGHPLVELQEDLKRPATPAFTRFTGDAVIDVMRNEGLGDDGITDMFWVEMKMPDYAGHAFNMTSPEEADVLRETDRQIGRFIDELDRTVGRGNYVFALSADHGQQPLPDEVGGWRINSRELMRDIERRFGDVVEKVTPVDIYVDENALSDSGYTASDIARYVGTYTLGDNIPDGAEGADFVPNARRDELLFAGAFSTEYLRGLNESQISGYGQGRYPEGDFTIGDD